MSVWDNLPLDALHRTTNYGCAGGVCEGRYANVYHAQAKAALGKIEQEITALRERDPSGYYAGDMDELLDCYKALTDRLKGPFA